MPDLGDLTNLDYGYDFSGDTPLPNYGFLGSQDAWDIQPLNNGMGVPYAPTSPLFYDNLTGNQVTMDQIRQMAGYENWQPPQQTSVSGFGGGSSPQIQQPNGAMNIVPPAGAGNTSPWSQILNSLPGGLAALGSLGITGAAIGSALSGGGSQAGPSSTSVTKPTALSDPRVQQILGSTGTGQGSALTGNSGLLGASNQAAQNLQGPNGLLQGQINAIPQLNPQIQQAIGANALGFSQGQVPTLNDPQAQAYFQNMLGGQNAAVDYNTTNSLANAIDMLRQRGFAGGSEIFREGSPAAAAGPILAAANLAKAQNQAGINSQQLQYATQLPQIGSQLNTQQLGAQQIPFNAYSAATATQGQLPQNTLNSLMQQGSTTNTSSQGASPTLLQSLGQLAPVLGAAGGLASGATANGQNPLSGLYGGISGLFNG